MGILGIELSRVDIYSTITCIYMYVYVYVSVLQSRLGRTGADTAGVLLLFAAVNVSRW